MIELITIASMDSPTYRTWYQNDDRLQINNFLQSNTPLEQSIQTPLDQFHTEELRVSSGLTVLALTVARVAWRLLNDPPPHPAEMKPWERHTANFALHRRHTADIRKANTR